MKPTYFIVERDNSPLWFEYISWLNETYNETWKGRDYRYYGCDGSRFNGTNAYNNISQFHNNPVLLTLEEWKHLFIQPKIHELWI